MKKDLVRSVRINSIIFDKIIKNGMTIQKIVDEYVDQKFSIQTKTTIKKRKNAK